MIARKPASLKSSHLWQQAKGVTAIGRHSIKGKTPTGLAPEGETKAAWSGSRLPKGFKVFASVGDQTRHKSTAKIMVDSFQGQKEAMLRDAAELGFRCVKDMSAVEKRIGEIGDPGVLAEWIDGKLPLTVIDSAEKVGREALQSAIGETNRLMKASAEKPLHLNLTSSWFESAVLKSLGIDYRSIKPKKGMAKVKPKQGDSLKETEALLFFHLPDGKVILSFRGRKFDVTRQLASALR